MDAKEFKYKTMKQTFLFFFALVIFSCGSHDIGLLEIDPENFSENEITLSEIADDIKYIPLDNNIPIGIIYSSRITKEHVYLSVKDIGILQFDRNGKLIRKIGNRGKGPNEYYYGLKFAVDETTENVYVLEPGKVIIYNQSGKLLRDVHYKEYIGGRMGGDIEIYKSRMFIADYLSTGESKYNWIFLDTLGDLVSKKVNSIPPFQTNIPMDGSVYIFNDKLFYYNYFNDTIFSISPDLSHRGEYLFATGNHRWPRVRLETNSENDYFATLSKLFKPGKMFETKHSLFLLYSYLDKYAICIVDKKTKETFLGYQRFEGNVSLVTTRPYIQNDVDGGFPLSESISYYFENGKEYIVQLLTSFDLIRYLLSDAFKDTIPKYPDKKKELEKLAESLKETDNPVLMMVRLKK